MQFCSLQRGPFHPHENNGKLLDMRTTKTLLKTLNEVNHKTPCTVIWQELPQSVLVLRTGNATDLISTMHSLSTNDMLFLPDLIERILKCTGELRYKKTVY